jgi:hypothetical protein
MLRALRYLEIAGCLSLALIWGFSPTVSASGPNWGRFESSGISSDVSGSNSVYYYGNNAAPSNSAPATAANANSVTYRSYSVEPGSSGFYYYSPGPCGCYSYAPGPSPTAATTAATTNGTAPAATAANAPSGTYRSFSPDAAPAATYPAANSYYSSPGTYYRSNSGGGRSWGGRH